MKIFVDFDGVIFDSIKFRKSLKKVFVKSGVSIFNYDSTFNIFSSTTTKKNTAYSPKKHINKLEKIEKINRKKIERNLKNFYGDLKKFVFPDAIHFLGKFNPDELFILSFGNRNFQRGKIKNSGVDKFFGKIIISVENKMDIIFKTAKEKNFKKNEKIFFIDDCPDNLKKNKRNRMHIKTLYMKRRTGSYCNLSCPIADFEINNLKQALKIIKTNNGK